MYSCKICNEGLVESEQQPGSYECHNDDCVMSGLLQPCPDSKPPQAVKGQTAAETVALRQETYGPFEVHAKAEQAMKKAMTSQPGWDKLNDVQKSAMEMIVHKMARILNSSPDYDDNWHDIAGYANLVEISLKNSSKTKPDGV